MSRNNGPSRNGNGLARQATNESSSRSAVPEQTVREPAEDFEMLMNQVGSAAGEYCRKHPGVATLAILGVGFYLGWKVKPW